MWNVEILCTVESKSMLGYDTVKDEQKIVLMKVLKEQYIFL